MLLIEPFGIEIIINNDDAFSAWALLIEPFGIEIITFAAEKRVGGGF